MPYRISYIDTSTSTDEQLRRDEFPTERARELPEDVSWKTVLISEIPTSI